MRFFALLLGFLALASPTLAAETLLPTPIAHFEDSNGSPCSGCRLYTYAAGSSTKLSTFTDITGATTNQNPVILNTRGEANVWVAPGAGYKIVLSPPTDTDPPTNAFWVVDNINGFGTGTAIIPPVTSKTANYTVASDSAASSGAKIRTVPLHLGTAASHDGANFRMQ